MKPFNGPKHQRGFIGLIATGVSLVASKVQADKAEKKGKRANAAQKKANKILNRQKRRKFIRQFRQGQADAYSSTIASGADFESSRAKGARSTAAAQLNQGLREAEQLEELGSQVGDLRQGQASSSARSAQYGQLASFASQFISFGPKGSPTVEKSTQPGQPN